MLRAGTITGPAGVAGTVATGWSETPLAPALLEPPPELPLEDELPLEEEGLLTPTEPPCEETTGSTDAAC